MNEIINIDSVDVYNKQFGLETLHPLVSVIDMNQATRLIGLKRFNYGIYALFLKMEKAATSNTDVRHTIIRKVPWSASHRDRLQKRLLPPTGHK